MSRRKATDVYVMMTHEESFPDPILSLDIQSSTSFEPGDSIETDQEALEIDDYCMYFGACTFSKDTPSFLELRQHTSVDHDDTANRQDPSTDHGERTKPAALPTIANKAAFIIPS
jgi:hypothetical protein